MIIFHKSNSDYSGELKDRLDRLSLSYEIESNDEEDSAPFIEEDGQFYKNKDEIESWFQELEEELNWQRSISGDGCYIDPKNGGVC